MTRTTEHLEKMLAGSTPGPWLCGQEGNNRVYGPDGMGDDSGLIAVVLKGRPNAVIIAAAPTITAELIAARKRIAELEGALRSSRDTLDFVAELCWDKSHGSSLKHICDESSQCCSDAAQHASAALEPKP